MAEFGEGRGGATLETIRTACHRPETTHPLTALQFAVQTAKCALGQEPCRSVTGRHVRNYLNPSIRRRPCRSV